MFFKVNFPKQWINYSTRNMKTGKKGRENRKAEQKQMFANNVLQSGKVGKNTDFLRKSVRSKQYASNSFTLITLFPCQRIFHTIFSLALLLSLPFVVRSW